MLLINQLYAEDALQSYVNNTNFKANLEWNE